MILVHDLVEAEAGDVPFFDDSGRAQKPARERAAIESIRRHLGPPLGEEFHDLWHEFERNSSAEARLASALDDLEVQIHHNLAAFESSTPAEYDLAYTKMDVPCAAAHRVTGAAATRLMGRRAGSPSASGLNITDERPRVARFLRRIADGKDARWRPGGHDGMMSARERLLRSIELPRPSSGAAETTKRGPET